jgi:hypothetical protein
MRGHAWFDSMKENGGRRNTAINEMEPSDDFSID